jgi:alkanesulfonate monooxygenase SsuD/methylene tetrahydromethanopterin reductase-like flavin-dependent oxidoreductase (luciferase family)
MSVEFISLINVWESSEVHPRPGGAPDAANIRKYARFLEDGGFDYTLVAYFSAGYDPFTVSATIAACTDRIKPIVALRPNTMYPTVAAQSLATLDHLSGGRAVVHIISGGSDAYRVGGALGDIFGLWGEPLADTREQMDRVAEQARKAGRTDVPRTWVTFRPIVAATDDLAWEKAHRTLTAVEQTHRGGGFLRTSLSQGAPQNVGSQRLLEIAARGDVQDRALWTLPAQVTGAMGASTALVGSYETVAAAILDQVDAGASIVSIRGFDTLNDVVDYGRHLLPLVRQEIAHRKATGQRGDLQRNASGFGRADFLAAHDAAASAAANTAETAPAAR